MNSHGKCSVKREHLFLAGILLLSFLLNIYGLNWGLPSRWNVDQSVTAVLNMLKDKSVFPQIYAHPSLYYYVLLLYLLPYLAVQYIFSPVFSAFVAASKISWNYMAVNYPGFAAGIFIWARSLSVIFSLLTVFAVYKIGSVVHSKKAGLFSALTLTLTMDFVSTAHLVKSISLVNLLTVISVYYAILVFKEYNFKKNFLLCCLFGGLACSTKFNGGMTFLLIPVLAFWRYPLQGRNILSKKYFVSVSKTIFLGTAVYILALLATSPIILCKAARFYTDAVVVRKTTGALIPRDIHSVAKIFFPNLVFLIHTSVTMFGIPLFLVIICGLAYSLGRCGLGDPAVSILCVFPVINLCLFALSPRVYESANSKFLIQFVPLLAVLGGIFLADLLKQRASIIRGQLAKAAVIVIFISAFFYCVSLDNLFAYNELRYHATKWIKSNIPKGANIVVLNQLEYSLGVEVLSDYNVYVIGGEAGSKGAYSFIKGEYAAIKEKKGDLLKKLDSFYVVRSSWKMNQSPMINFHSLDILPSGYKLRKILERKKFWYWNPCIGNYEPDRIEIFVIK